MIRLTFLLFFHFVIGGFCVAQDDTLPRPIDSTVPPILPDTIRKIHVARPAVSARFKPKVDSLINDTTKHQGLDTAWKTVALRFVGKNFMRLAWDVNKFFGFSSPPITSRSDKKEFKGKEVIFYSLLSLLLFFAFLKFSFPKYLGDLFRVAFKTTLKQRQIGEQLVQTPLPSLLLNIFFVLSASFYISFVVQHYRLAMEYNFWLLYSYCVVGLTVIYIIKFLTLKFSGWLFNITITTDGYLFIVFMINKIIGIYLLPFLVLLAFTNDGLYEAAFVLSYIGVFALLAYRFILSYSLARSQIKVNPFHFFLYLCAFEIVPLLLIYKALMLWF